VLLMDMDGLKRINDEHGHLVGSESICRLARILHMECRSLDTAARYGGDEFGLILPETSEAAAHEVAIRIQKRLASEAEQPRLGVSIGVATYPTHGLTVSMLLEAADQELYAVKAHSKTKKPPKFPRGL
jgi:diguanylate cyclase (GGDEF)-like protein